MKKSTWLLPLFVFLPVICAQAEENFFSREQVLEAFERFNPQVLENARQDEAYQQILEQLVSSYRAENTPANWIELVALTRNFDNSIQLESLKQIYRQAWLTAKMSGGNMDPVRRDARQDVIHILTQVWAVTVQVREYQLKQIQAQLRELSGDKTLTPEEKAAQQESLTQGILSLRNELKGLQQDPGEYIVSMADNYMANLDKSLNEETFSVQRNAAEQKEQTARETDNLQIKNKNKKPVAK